MASFNPIWKSVQGTQELWQVRQRKCQKYLSADFQPIWNDTTSFEGGYQQISQDNGNWSSGKSGVGTLVGTNHGISAPTLAQWLGTEPNAAQMKALTVDTAMQIAKKFYWDKILGDEILQAGIAACIFDFFWASGYTSFKMVRQAINQVAGSNVVDATSVKPIDTTDLKYINSLDPTQLFNAIMVARNNYDNSLSSASTFGVGWKNRLDAIYNKYIGTLGTLGAKTTAFVKQNIVPILIITFGVLVTISVLAAMSAKDKPTLTPVPAT